MRTSQIIVISGMTLFFIGISIIAYEIYGNSDFRLNVETEIMILFGTAALGLAITGIGVMIDFSKKKWGQAK